MTATSQTNSAVTASTSANLTIATTSGLTAQFQNGVQVIPIPGTTSFLLMVQNTGNTQDSYTATISGTSGPVTASLTGLDGLPTAVDPHVHPPRPEHRRVVLNTDLSAAGTGMVTVQCAVAEQPVGNRVGHGHGHDPDADANANSNANANADSNAHADSDAHADTNSNANAHTDTNSQLRPPRHPRRP